MTELERVVILVGIFVIVALVLWGRGLGVRRPAVPPAVAPQQHPLEEDVARLRHWRPNAEQVLFNLGDRMGRQESESREVRQILGRLLEGQERNEEMLNTLVQNGLKRS